MDNDDTEKQTQVLECRLFCKKVEYAVSLTSDRIRCQNLKSKSRPPTVILLSDVVAVQPLQLAEPRLYGLQLHHIHKQENSVWKLISLDLSSRDALLVERLLRTLKDMHSKIIFETDRPQKLLVYINPVSGGSRGLQIYRKHAEPVFHLAHIKVHTVVTERAGHICEHVMDYDLSQVDGVVVVGGDGTFSEAAKGLISKRLKEEGRDVDDLNLRLTPLDIPIGIVPAGTGQGNAKTATGTADPVTAALNIVVGHTYRIDAFSVHDGSRLLSIGNLLCGFGFFSNWIQASESHRWMGRPRYGYGFVKTMSDLQRFQAEVELDLIKHNEDGSIDFEHSEPHVVRGRLLEVAFFPYDLATKTTTPGVMHVDVFHEHANRKKMVHYLSRMARMRTDTYDFDFIERFQALSYRIRVEPDSSGTAACGGNAASGGTLANGGAANSMSTSGENAASGGTAANGTPLRNPACINIDGDAYPYSGPVLHLRTNANIIRIYGQRHARII